MIIDWDSMTLYHDAGCYLNTIAATSMTTGAIIGGNIPQINRTRALRLHAKSKINSPDSIDGFVDQNHS